MIAEAADRTDQDDWLELELSAGGDHGAFSRLVERHQERLFRLCLRMLGDPSEAEEAVQEVFIKLYQKAARFRPAGQLYTLLYRIASNHCLNRLRRRRIVRFLPLQRDGDGSGEVLGPQPVDPSPDAASRLEATQRWRRTEALIRRLPPSQRAVVVLVRFEGLSYRRTAEVLGISIGAVESRLFRAMRRLEAALAKQE